jgi:NADPH:quinone reductase-like Zn-dependent oxidoreductase
MKAAFRSKYGPGKVLSIKQLDKPIPKNNELLIRVYASSANRTDYHVLSGRPFIMRLFTGLFKPRLAITGTDFAGQIEAVGSTVRSFKAGDKIMGYGGVFGCGSHAQYFTLPETKGIVFMPGNITYEQAAACLEGAFYAASSLIQLNPTAGQKALVYGATGAIGSSHVQFLKYYGVYVTAVCGGENRELVRSWGADKVIDYKTEDFTKDEERYDYVFDAIGKSSFAKCKRLLKKHGMYFPSNGLENLFLVPITRLFGGKRVMFTGPKNIKGTLTFIKGLLEQGSFRPVIDRIYPLEKIAEAFTYVATGQKIGNVIITMDA